MRWIEQSLLKNFTKTSSFLHRKMNSLVRVLAEKWGREKAKYSGQNITAIFSGVGGRTSEAGKSADRGRRRGRGRCVVKRLSNWVRNWVRLGSFWVVIFEICNARLNEIGFVWQKRLFPFRL